MATDEKFYIINIYTLISG